MSLHHSINTGTQEPTCTKFRLACQASTLSCDALQLLEISSVGRRISNRPADIGFNIPSRQNRPVAIPVSGSESVGPPSGLPKPVLLNYSDVKTDETAMQPCMPCGLVSESLRSRIDVRTRSTPAPVA